MVPTRLKSVWVAAAALLAVGAALLLLRGRGRPPPKTLTPAADLPPVDAAAKVVYDPTKLIEGGVPAGEVFLKEPRDPVWAEVVENVVGGKMREDLARLVPEASLHMQCKTLTCLIGVDAPEDKRPLALAVVKVVMLGPFLIDFDPEPDGTQRLLFATEPRMSDPQTFTDWYMRVRRRTFQTIKDGSRENPLPIPAEKLPDE